ncbi:MAG: hypothetical protein JJ863_19785 [Deltaproteobacteria bacterium]|nr:hypothetical protein [Deltaproteobacteria bacterium]
MAHEISAALNGSPTEHLLAHVFGGWVEHLICTDEPRAFDCRTAGARVRLEAVEADTWRLVATHPAFETSIAAYRCPCCAELGSFVVERFVGDARAAVRWVRDHRRGRPAPAPMLH